MLYYSKTLSAMTQKRKANQWPRKPKHRSSPTCIRRLSLRRWQKSRGKHRAKSHLWHVGEKRSDKIIHAHDWKWHTHYHPDGYFELQTEDMGDVPVRLFFTQRLLDEAEDALYGQIVNATRFPGVKLVAITPDAHFGYGVPVGSVILTDGTLAMGPVGYDIGCGMVSASPQCLSDAATPDRRLAFNKAVMRRVEMGAGGKSTTTMRSLSQSEFVELIHGGADYYISKYGAPFDRSRAERNRIPVDDNWDVPWGGRGRPERGIPSLARSAGATTLWSFKVARKLVTPSSCRCTAAAAASGTAWPPTTSSWLRRRSPTRSSISTWATSLPTRRTTVAT